MRRLLGLLREDTAGHAPLPHLGRLPELVDDAVAAGLNVRTEVSLSAALSPSLDLAAYRIVQESLNNCRRHAPGSQVEISITADDRRLVIAIVNAETETSATRESGSGFGIVGMRERAAIYHGRLDAGPTDDGRFRVRAEFPLVET
jgi:signal transduction histidine kinase